VNASGFGKVAGQRPKGFFAQRRIAGWPHDPDLKLDEACKGPIKSIGGADASA
jgi:hypothetical protein